MKEAAKTPQPQTPQNNSREEEKNNGKQNSSDNLKDNSKDNQKPQPAPQAKQPAKGREREGAGKGDCRHTEQRSLPPQRPRGTA